MRKARFAVLLALNFGAAWAVHRNPASPGYEFMPDMARSVPYDAYAPNPVTHDGRTLQAPVAGTIAFGGPLPFRYAATTAEAERAGRELRNPIPPTPAALARGQHLYQTFCIVCHGPQGAGDGPIIAKKFPAPPSYTSTRLLSMPDGQIFHVITRGTEVMPSYGGQISPDNRWNVIHYVRRLQARAPIRLAAVRP